MKITRIIALALALVTASALVACNNSSDDDTTTTTASTTTTVSTTTTKAPDTNEPPTTEPAGPVAETPATGLDLAALLGSGTNLQSLVTDVAATGATFWGDGAPANAFDGNTTSTKIGGGDITGSVDITWKTSAASTIKSYVVYTGGDSADYGRLPYSWEFSGSNDDGATWTVIDKVDISGVTKANSAPFGYTVDTPAAYTSYKFSVTDTSADGTAGGAGVLQMNEIVLIGDAEGVTGETPVTDAAEIDAMIAGGTNLSANVKDPAATNITLWGDGVATNAFDGNTTGTKLGGNGSAGVVNVTWTTDVATTVKNYIIYTGGDSAQYGRTPISWVLYGSNDGETWTIIDYVANSGMVNSDSTPYGFTVDAPAAYTSYTLCITGALNNTGAASTPGANFDLQFNELVLIGDAAAAE